jgi:hypothetical protein
MYAHPSTFSGSWGLRLLTSCCGSAGPCSSFRSAFKEPSSLFNVTWAFLVGCLDGWTTWATTRTTRSCGPHHVPATTSVFDVVGTPLYSSSRPLSDILGIDTTTTSVRPAYVKTTNLPRTTTDDLLQPSRCLTHSVTARVRATCSRGASRVRWEGTWRKKG